MIKLDSIKININQKIKNDGQSLHEQIKFQLIKLHEKYVGKIEHKTNNEKSSTLVKYATRLKRSTIFDGTIFKGIHWRSFSIF